MLIQIDFVSYNVVCLIGVYINSATLFEYFWNYLYDKENKEKYQSTDDKSTLLILENVTATFFNNKTFSNIKLKYLMSAIQKDFLTMTVSLE